MPNSAKPQVDDMLAGESHQLQEEKIYDIRGAMEVQVYGAEQ